jgi:hypothetical protein
MLVTLPRLVRDPLFQAVAPPMMGVWVATSCSWASRALSGRSAVAFHHERPEGPPAGAGGLPTRLAVALAVAGI